MSSLERFSQAKNIDDVRVAFLGAVSSFGLEYFILGSSMVEHRNILSNMLLVNCWPDGWAERYQREGYLKIDPVAKFTKISKAPFLWSEAPGASESLAVRRFMEMSAQDYRMKTGICIPIYGLTGYQASVSLAGQDVDLSADSRSAIELISFYAFNSFIKFRNPIKTAILTTREREVMKWAATGKSAWETSEILSISEETVKSHVASVMRKLDVHSKIHAVAESLRRGEISG